MTQYITIKDASDLSGKSVQTIRRMLKSKKLKYRKDRTPQGFNYLIDLSSLKESCNISQAEVDKADLTNQIAPTPLETKPQKVSAIDLDLRTPKAEIAPEEAQALVTPELDRSHQQIVSYEPVKEFTDTIQQIVSQHGKEKENLFRLIETFQNKVISLENKLKVESNSKSWFKFW
jgi:hypothetical protein